MSQSRVPEIDALRGLALFGILMVNVWFFADSSNLSGGPDPSTATGGQLAIGFAVDTLFEGKFYLLFALLFGYGVAVMRAGAGPASTRLLSRRLGALAVLGMVHGLTLFYGDILLTYSLAGCILLATISITARAALTAAVAITAGIAFLFVASAALALVDPTGGAPAVEIATAAATSTPAAALGANAATYGAVLPSIVLFQGPLALAAFYAGYALASLGVLRPDAPPRPVLGRVVALTLPLGLAGSAAQAYLGIWGEGTAASLLTTAISVAASPLMTLGYAALFLLLLRTGVGRTLEAVLIPTGRLSLSNYLAQSVLLGLVFTGYGLGLMDRLPGAAVVLVVVVLFTLQAGASRLVLARWRTGPLEWALRRIVYGVPRQGPRHHGRPDAADDHG